MNAIMRLPDDCHKLIYGWFWKQCSCPQWQWTREGKRKFRKLRRRLVKKANGNFDLAAKLALDYATNANLSYKIISTAAEPQLRYIGFKPGDLCEIVQSITSCNRKRQINDHQLNDLIIYLGSTSKYEHFWSHRLGREIRSTSIIRHNIRKVDVNDPIARCKLCGNHTNNPTIVGTQIMCMYCSSSHSNRFY